MKGVHSICQNILFVAGFHPLKADKDNLVLGYN
jgi:hypothetical protein